MTRRKLIEVALPLEAVNRESAHEKSVPRKGHPATLHLWWARRPLGAVRALLFAQLVDDPSSRPEEFPTEAEQRVERERLHKLVERLAKWENTTDTALMSEAHREIMKSTDDNPPAILDPFAGGGTIPLEAQRLGLEAHASDLNPVAVLINKALIEIPPNFTNQPPVFPGLASSEIRGWQGAQGLAADVRAYGQWMRNAAEQRIGQLYPDATLSDGSKAKTIAWIWARTLICPNPACGIEAPLVRSWWLAKKKGRETFIVPSVVPDTTHPSGSRVEFDIRVDPNGPQRAGTMAGRQGGVCLSCGTVISKEYIKAQGMADEFGARLMATVAAGNRKRVYLAPTVEHERAAEVDKPTEIPEQELGFDPRNLWTPSYGLIRFNQLFTDRQLVTLTTFSDLVNEAHKRVIQDGGSDAYADAIATYLAFLGSKLADWLSSVCGWIPQIEGVRDTFARQAISMAWDFVEINPLSESVGNVSGHFEWIVKALETLPVSPLPGEALQADAASRPFSNYLLATDPPYYDNIAYSDLSDFFYVWLRRTLRSIHPNLMSTMVVPKAEELVANPYRHQGKDGAREFFENGFRSVFAQARQSARTDFPITVWYAFKQSENDSLGEASKGWETLLEGMIRSGWKITSTWPSRSERSGRMISVGKNALASSIVLSLRPRPEGAPTTDRRGFVAMLASELPDALRKLQQGQIAPVDLPQAAIGPGMAVFSRYSAVLEQDGKKMTVRSALTLINELLDQVLNEQEGDFDTNSRFALAWYRQHGYGTGSFGDADNLARARNTSVEVMDRVGILISRAGKVELVKPADLALDYSIAHDADPSNWETLHHLIQILERDGVSPAGQFLHTAMSRSDQSVDPDLVKELAHLLFRVAEGRSWTKDALSFNALVTSWPDIVEMSRKNSAASSSQGAFDYEDE